MKKLGFLLFYGLVVFLPSCDNCGGCNKDQALDPCIEYSIPYQVGDTVMFRSSLDDTIAFVCSERKYYQNLEPPKAGNGYECCEPYESENLSATLNKDDNMIKLRSDYLAGGYYDLILSLAINGKSETGRWGLCRYDGYHIATVSLADRIFNNAIRIKLGPSALDSIYINSEDQYGVIGFKVDGVEWAKID